MTAKKTFNPAPSINKKSLKDAIPIRSYVANSRVVSIIL
jgi:hypothetical protein